MQVKSQMESMPPRTTTLEAYHSVLQIPSGAEVAAVKKAYRKLALILHPDKNPDFSDVAEGNSCRPLDFRRTMLCGDARFRICAAAAFKVIQAAHAALSDPMEKAKLVVRVMGHIFFSQRIRLASIHRNPVACMHNSDMCEPS